MWSKTLSEKELLRYNDDESSRRAFEVVSLVCALVGGDTVQPDLGNSIQVLLAPLTGHAAHHNSLLFMQALLGSVPLAHVEDVCEAHAFCMDQPAMASRFLCAAGYPNMRDILDRFASRFPDIKIRLQQYVVCHEHHHRQIVVALMFLLPVWFMRLLYKSLGRMGLNNQTEKIFWS